jgi:hypothetical protein
VSATRRTIANVDQTVGGICRGFDENHRNPPFAHGVLRCNLDCGFVDAIGEANRADGDRALLILRHGKRQRSVAVRRAAAGRGRT